MLASVLVQYNIKTLNKTFDYIIPNSLIKKIRVGNKVLVPFGKKNIEGFVIKIKTETKQDYEYKQIIKIIEEDFYLKKDLLLLGEYLANKTMSNLISCYQVMLPSALKSNNVKAVRKYEIYVFLNKSKNVEQYILSNQRKKKEIEIINKLKSKQILKKDLACKSLENLIKNGIVLLKKKEISREILSINEEYKKVSLTQEQKDACKKIIEEKKQNLFLLHGVTGSGKTEVYISLINDALNKNKTAIFLVPEISLTPQIVSRFKFEFGDKIALLHSKLSEGEKYDEYRKIMNGKAKVVIGARSAVFAPLENIGIIIIDECQSTTYKQESTPKYNGIDVAMERARLHNCKCVLGSATPLLEQYARAVNKNYTLIELKSRISLNNPHIEIVNMEDEVKKRNFIISSLLDKKIREAIDKKEQTILLLNRRGYSTFISCSNCGYVHKCPNCDISLIYHKTNNYLSCHYCGYTSKMDKKCPSCHEDAIKDLGLGTEKLEELIKNKYNAKVLRMDADTTKRKGSYEKYIDEFKNHKYDILIGTQMISKGLNFPGVTVVGILNIDNSLALPDFRSSERTFELLTQTSGRSARFEKEGKVIIQTYNPDNYVFKFLLKGNYISFYNYEMSIRKKLKYPPYYNIAFIKVTSSIYEEAKKEINKIKQYLEESLNKNFIILGPSTGRIFKLKNNYNFGIIIKYRYEENLFEVLREINSNTLNKKINIDIDINPINVL